MNELELNWVINRMPPSDDRYLEIMSIENVEKARRFHMSFPQYSVTAMANLKKMADYLGYAMAQISTVVDPQIYLIGGGVGGGFKTYAEDLRASFRKYCLAPSVATRILPASLGNDAAMYGCAYEALTERGE